MSRPAAKRRRLALSGYEGGFSSVSDEGAMPVVGWNLGAPVDGATLDISGDGSVAGTLTVGTLSVTGSETLGSLHVTGTSALDGSATAGSTFSFLAGLNSTGAAQFSGGAPSLKTDTFQATGAGTMAALHVTGTSALDGTVTCGANIAVPGGATLGTGSDTGVISIGTGTGNRNITIGSNSFPTTLNARGTLNLGTASANSVTVSSATGPALSVASTSGILVPATCTAIDTVAGGGVVDVLPTASTIRIRPPNAGQLTLCGAGATCSVSVGSIPGTGNSATVNINNSDKVGAGNITSIDCGTGAGTVSISNGTGTQTIAIGNATGPTPMTLAGTVNINPSGARVITIGNTSGPTTTTMLGPVTMASTGGNVNSFVYGNSTLTASTFSIVGSQINFGTSSDSQTISIGTSGARTMVIGNGAGASTTDIRGNFTWGTGDTAAGTTFHVADGATYTTVHNISMGNTSANPSVLGMIGTINMGTTADTQTLSIGTGGARSLALGNSGSSTPALGTWTFGSTPTPVSAGGASLGTSSLPWSSLVLGSTATSNASTSFTTSLVTNASVAFSAAQIQGMNATPLLCLAAPAAGFVNMVQRWRVRLISTGTAFGGGGPIALQYGNTAGGAGPNVSTTMPASLLASTSSQWYQLAGSSIQANTNATTSSASNTIAGLYLSNATGAFTLGGTATVIVNIWYSIESV